MTIILVGSTIFCSQCMKQVVLFAVKAKQVRKPALKGKESKFLCSTRVQFKRIGLLCHRWITDVTYFSLFYPFSFLSCDYPSRNGTRKVGTLPAGEKSNKISQSNKTKLHACALRTSRNNQCEIPRKIMRVRVGVVRALVSARFERTRATPGHGELTCAPREAPEHPRNFSATIHRSLKFSFFSQRKRSEALTAFGKALPGPDRCTAN